MIGPAEAGSSAVIDGCRGRDEIVVYSADSTIVLHAEVDQASKFAVIGARSYRC